MEAHAVNSCSAHPRDKIVKLMHNKNLNFSDEIVRLIYSPTGDKRYVLLKNSSSLYSYVYEEIELFDEQELQWMGYREGIDLPAYWSQHSGQSISLYGTPEDALKDLRAESNYKKYFNAEINPDICVPCGEGLVNLRVGAIIIKEGKLLMVGNERADYLYSVGGRIKMGETAEEAVVREVFEETGVKLEVDRLGFVHENFFYGDAPSNLGKLIYEISFFFFMKVPMDFEPVSSDFTEFGERENLRWISPDEDITYYPEFFRTELKKPFMGVKHIVTDERRI